MSISDKIARLTEINQERESGDINARQRLLFAAQELCVFLFTPSEFVSHIGWSEPARFAALRTALDLKLLEQLNDDGATVDGVAASVNAEPALIVRLLKHLAAEHIVLERAENTYAHTPLSKQLIEPRYRDGILYLHDLALPSFNQMPAFLKESSYIPPSNPLQSPFQEALHTKDHFFAWLDANPEYCTAFATYMGGYRKGKPLWFEFYPIKELLNVDHACLVDVGGGQGHDLLDLEKTGPIAKLILQDKPEVIATVSLPSSSKIEAQSHDFFAPQPVQAARAYFLHSILHNWDDASCVKILESLKPGMKAGYSKVLIHDLIMPDQQASWPITSMDMLMMVLVGVKERTEKEFRALFERAGLKIERIWSSGDASTESVIEAVLP